MHVFISAAESKAHMHPFAPASQTQGYRDMLESLECPGCVQAISCDVEVKHGGPMRRPQSRYGDGSRPMKFLWFWGINIHSPAIIRVHRVPEFWLIALYPKISNALFQTLLFWGKPGGRIQLPGSIWSPSPALMLALCSQPVAPAVSTRDCWSSRSIWKTRGKASRHVVTGLQWNMVGLCWFILHKKRGKPNSYQPPPKVGLLLGLPHYMQSS